jgi:hypothetical protein
VRLSPGGVRWQVTAKNRGRKQEEAIAAPSKYAQAHNIAIYNNLISYDLINVAVWGCGRIDLEESK